MFAGHTFCVSLTTSSLTVAALTQRGGAVVYDLGEPATITCVVIAANDDPQPLQSCAAAAAAAAIPAAASVRRGRGWAVRNGFAAALEDRVRAARVPVVYELWVHQSVRAGHPLLPCKGSADVVAYDPMLFAGLRFTTTQLPLQLKANIIAVLQFYGAEYHRHLLDTTNTLVYSHMQLKVHHDGSKVSNGAVGAAAVASAVVGADSVQASTRRDTAASSSVCAAASTFHLSGAAPQRSPPATTTMPAIHDTVAAPMTKLSVARQRGLRCVTPQWVQLCLNAGALLPPLAPPTSASAAKPVTVPALQEEEDTCLAANASSAVSLPTTVDEAAGTLYGVEAGKRNTYDDLETQERAAVERWVGDALEEMSQHGDDAPAAIESVNLDTPADTPAPAPACPSTTCSVASLCAAVAGSMEDVARRQLSRSAAMSRTVSTIEADPEVRKALNFADRLAAAAAAPARGHKRRRTV